jgi:monoamine oxidase
LAVLRKQVRIAIPGFPQYFRDFFIARPAGRNVKTMLFFDQPLWKEFALGNRFNLLTERFWIWDNSDNVSLTAFAGGSNAERLKELSDIDLEDELLDALSQVVPNIRQHHVLTLRGPHWHDDKWARESYTGSTLPGVNVSDQAYDLPYFKNIYFAGTGFSKEHEGFMNGAVETGNLAAAWIINHSASHKD